MSRRGGLAPSVLLVAILAILSSAVPVAAEGTARVFLFGPVGTLHIGDTVTVTIRVFSSGIGVDPESLSAYVSAQAASRNLSLVRQAVGSYAATFQILSADVPGTYEDGTGPVFIIANATVDGTAYFAGITLTVEVSPPALPPLGMALSLSEDWIAPGSNVSVDATVEFFGVLRDADTLSVSGTFQRPFDAASIPFNIPMAHAGPGQYHSGFQIPSDMPQDTMLSVLGQAILGNYTVYATSSTARVGWPHDLTIWYHVRTVASAYSLVDVLVANGTGGSVEGATVTLRYDAIQSCVLGSCRPTPRWVSERTGRTGAAAFNLTYWGDGTTVFFPIEGNVSVGTRSQTYSGLVVSPEMYGPYAPSLCPTGDVRSYAPGEEVRLTYHGSCGYGGPFQNYSYYAYTSEGIVANGSVQADAGGNFSLTFVAPPESAAILIDTNLTAYHGGPYFFMDALRVADPSLIHIANLGIGQAANITVDILGEGGTVSLIPYNGSRITAPEYSGWFPEISRYLGLTVAAVPGAPFQAHLVVPRFLPKDRDYLLQVNVGDPATMRWVYTYADVIHMANLPPAASAVFSSQDPLEGETVTVNASASSDPDGVIVASQVDWGDGSVSAWSETLSANHTYAYPGVYTVTVQVRDDSGAQSAVAYPVRVDAALFGMRASYVYAAVIGAVAITLALAVLFRRRRRPGRLVAQPEADAPTTTQAGVLEAGSKPPDGR